MLDETIRSGLVALAPGDLADIVEHDDEGETGDRGEDELMTLAELLERV